MKINFNELGLFQYQINEEIANKIFDELSNLEYKNIYQERMGHYSHVFRDNDKLTPDINEKYIASFGLADNNEGSKEFNKFFNEEFLVELKKEFPELKYYLKPNINKIGIGDFFRTHQDSYAGDVGYTFFFSKNWKWDYGGILTFTKGEKAESIFPLNGKCLIRNEKQRISHFVSQVCEYSKEEYYLIVGWSSIEDHGESEVRGKYHKI
jgi:Rps23 Pro-64 3,4-dihydroxylase Tpa1-like proline 4-hydroxylase